MSQQSYRYEPPADAIIAVGSGKGGVGKSTVSLNLALALAERGSAVGLLDADIYGPNIPLMLGLVREKWGQNWTIARAGQKRRIQPFECFGLRVMSAGFIIGENQPLADSSLIGTLAGQFIADVDWGKLDYLIIDLPPGTGEAQQTFLRATRVSGAVLVVTPQDVAHLDARKAVEVYRRAQVPVLGAVENMSGFVCPDCGTRHALFPPVREARSLWAMGVPKLGEIPIDPVISLGGDTGKPLLIAHPDSPQSEAFRRIAERLARELAGPEE